jgi:predicted DCC family thiol-disulfide oxidoreductase YuxK
MCLQLILRRVGPSVVSLPSVCPYENCQGRHFEHHQEVDKLLKDTGYGMVSAHRYRCLRCERTFRVYPLGVTRAQTSQRVKGLGVKQSPPGRGEKATVAYRLRLMYLDRWNLWRPLTRCRTWQGPKGQTVDGTNNGCERAIGWWVKERYRLAPSGSYYARLQTPPVGRECQPLPGLVEQSSGSWRSGSRSPRCIGAQTGERSSTKAPIRTVYQTPNGHVHAMAGTCVKAWMETRCYRARVCGPSHLSGLSHPVIPRRCGTCFAFGLFAVIVWTWPWSLGLPRRARRHSRAGCTGHRPSSR